MRISDWSSDVCSSDLAALGAALLDHDAVEPLDRVAAGGDAPAGDEGVDQCAKSAPDHRQPNARGNPEMLDVIFIDALRMIDEQALEHAGFLSGCRLDRKSVVRGKRVSGRVTLG